MKSLLKITCSPRGENAHSTQLAEFFVDSLCSEDSSWHVDTLDLWQQSLPAMSGSTLTAKYAVFEGAPLNREQQDAWQTIEQLVEQFSQATLVVFALPVWNFGIPYVLKHYIDVITQPGLCFSWNIESGYTSLLTPKQAVIFSSSASDYSIGAGNQDDDFSLRYLQRWLAVYMACQVQIISHAPTVHSPDIVSAAKQQAYDQALILSKKLTPTKPC